MDYMEKERRCREFIEALDEERRKIEVFHRELPLCLHLVNQTIESYKKLMMGSDTLIINSIEEPVVKEFISLKPTTPICEDTGLNHDDQEQATRKLHWMNSSDQQPKQDHLEKPITLELEVQHIDNKNKDRIEAPADSSEATGSTSDQVKGNDSGSQGEGKVKKSEPKRKIRRCWSEELHKRFVQTLQQLGGCHVATPKQIRELMKEDGLTNDEIKSHLQKYRLHKQRTNCSTTQNIHDSNIAAAQFIFVGGLCIPQLQECVVSMTNNETSGKIVATNVPSNQMYNAPIVSLVPLQKGYPINELLSYSHSNK